jgi:hypothetical protein
MFKPFVRQDVAVILQTGFESQSCLRICTGFLSPSMQFLGFSPGSWPPNRRSTVLPVVKSFVSVPWMTLPSCRGLSLGTRVGSTGMIRRVNDSLSNGTVQDVSSLLHFLVHADVANVTEQVVTKTRVVQLPMFTQRSQLAQWVATLPALNHSKKHSRSAIGWRSVWISVRTFWSTHV